jgi:hypothetical protein
MTTLALLGLGRLSMFLAGVSMLIAFALGRLAMLIALL